MRRLLPWGVRAVAGLVLLVAAFLAFGNAWTRDVDADAVSYARTHLRTPIESRRVDANGIRLHVVLAGPEAGMPVVLLHGHGDFWWGWRHQIDPLADAGMRVIAPAR